MPKIPSIFQFTKSTAPKSTAEQLEDMKSEVDMSCTKLKTKLRLHKDNANMYYGQCREACIAAGNATEDSKFKRQLKDMMDTKPVYEWTNTCKLLTDGDTGPTPCANYLRSLNQLRMYYVELNGMMNSVLDELDKHKFTDESMKTLRKTRKSLSPTANGKHASAINALMNYAGIRGSRRAKPRPILRSTSQKYSTPFYLMFFTKSNKNEYSYRKTCSNVCSILSTG